MWDMLEDYLDILEDKVAGYEGDYRELIIAAPDILRLLNDLLGYGGLTRPSLGPLGLLAGTMMLNAFVVTTLDTATRIQRYVISELAAGFRVKALSNRWVATLIAVGTEGAEPHQKIIIISL